MITVIDEIGNTFYIEKNENDSIEDMKIKICAASGRKMSITIFDGYSYKDGKKFPTYTLDLEFFGDDFIKIKLKRIEDFSEFPRISSIEDVEYYLDKGFGINHEDCNGNTMLLSALTHDHILDFFIKKGANFSHVNSKNECLSTIYRYPPGKYVNDKYLKFIHVKEKNDSMSYWRSSR